MAEIKDTLLVSPNTIKRDSMVNYNVEEKDVCYAIRNAQEIYLKEIIGCRLLKKLKELVYNSINEIEPNIDSEECAIYNELLYDYVVPYLTYKTQVEMVDTITFNMRNIGVSKDSDINIQTQQDNVLNALKMRLETFVNEAANYLSKYLCKYKSDYPELSEESECNCGETCGNLVGETFANTNLWLGGKHNKCKCK